MFYVAGLDGGGTKTAVTVMDADGRIVREFEADGINYNGRDSTSVERSLSEIMATLSAACGGLEAIPQIVVGAAGVSNPTVPERLTSAIRSFGFTGDIEIAGDHETALYGALEGKEGMILVAGTGSICYGRNAKGLTGRTGGYGHLIDDGGSGYSIGRDLLAAAVRASDGRAPATVITKLLAERNGLATDRQIVGFVYDRSTGKKEIAALAPLLTEACALGDQAALAIARTSAAALVELVTALAARLSLSTGPLALSGSVLLKNPYVRSAFELRLKAALLGLAPAPAKHSASVGAALLARRLLVRRQSPSKPL